MNLKRFVKFGVQRLVGAEVHAVGINLTRRCNLDCEYCKIVDNSREKMEKELSVDQWKVVIDNFVKHGHRHFVFTGGEPMIYRGLYDLIDYTSAKAMTSLISNTTFFNEERFGKLKNLDYLTFSFDTVNEDDLHFTKHSSPKLAMITEQCKKHNITPSAIVTVTSKNTDQVEEMVKQLDAHGITAMLSLIHSDDDPHFDFRNYTPHLEFTTELDYKRLEKLQARLIQMKRQGYGIAETDEYIYNMSAYSNGAFQVDCPAADPFFTVDYDGRIKACHDTPASDVSALEFTDYRAMQSEIKKTIKPGCNCYYNCYVYGRNGMMDDLKRALDR